MPGDLSEIRTSGDEKISVGAGAKLDRDGSKLDTGDGAKLDFWGIAP
jgi:hypothetical protein